MRLVSVIILLVFVPPIYQSPQETIRQHYESAEAQRRAGNLAAAELEYAAILGEGYERLGEIYSAQQDYKRAIPVFESAAGYRPNSSAVLIAQAIACFGAGQYDRALEVARKALVIEPQSAGAHQMLGKTYFMLGDLGKSISELETAAKLAPDDIDVVYTLGIAYLRNRQSAAAKQLYESMIKQFGEGPQLHIIIGRAYRQSGLLSEAAEEFKKAIALDPHFPRSHHYLGITYLEDEGQSKIGEALEEFKIEVAANPDEFFANYYLGVVYIFQRKWDLAATFLQKASSIEPNNPDPYFQLGQAYQELNQHEQAVDVLKKSIALNPELAHNKNQVTKAHARLAQSLLKLGQTEAGQKELQIASDLKAQAFKLEQQTVASRPGTTTPGGLPARDTNLSEPGFGQQSLERDEKTIQELNKGAAYYEKVLATVHNNVGLLRAERQDYLVAAQQFAMAVKWNPKQEGLDYNLGLAYYKSGLFEEAIAPLENELKTHPENLQATVLLGMSYFVSEKYARASELLGTMVDSTTGDIDTYYALASSLIKQGKTDVAERVIGQMKTVSDSPQLHLLLGERYFFRGDRARTLAELGEAAVLNSSAPRVHYYAGLLYLKLARVDEAIREFDQELAINPNDLKTKYHLADTLLANRNLDRGIKLMREIIQARPEQAEAHYKLGQALLQRGDVSGAIENLESAAKLDPEKPDVHYQLGQAYISAGRKAEGKNQIDISKQLKSKTPKSDNNNDN